jgi:lipoic acid synthetase
VAETVARLGLGYAVITSVTRDDLGDGGAAHFVRTIREIRTVSPHTRIEVLVPDFRGDAAAIAALVEAAPDVIGHNLETVPRLYGSIRPEAEYRRSLMLLKTVRALDAGLATKSGIMLGLGETVDEVVAVLDDLISVGCTLLWLGQYLQPDPACTPVERYITPDEFDSLRDKALCMGFRGVASAPFVRSSYHAGELYEGLRTAALS